MRRTWLVCGWATLGAGLVGLLALGLAALGGARGTALLTPIVVAAALVVAGQGMIASARSMRVPATPAEEAADAAASRRMWRQAVWIFALVLLGVAALIVLMALLVKPAPAGG